MVANPFAVAFSEDLHLFAALSGTEDFFELWEATHFSVVSVFDNEDVRDSFQRTDYKLMRTATCWTKFIAHQTHNKGGNHGITSALRVAVITVDVLRTSSDAHTRVARESLPEDTRIDRYLTPGLLA